MLAQYIRGGVPAREPDRWVVCSRVPTHLVFKQPTRVRPQPTHRSASSSAFRSCDAARASHPRMLSPRPDTAYASGRGVWIGSTTTSVVDLSWSPLARLQIRHLNAAPHLVGNSCRARAFSASRERFHVVVEGGAPDGMWVRPVAIEARIQNGDRPAMFDVDVVHGCDLSHLIPSSARPEPTVVVRFHPSDPPQLRPLDNRSVKVVQVDCREGNLTVLVAGRQVTLGAGLFELPCIRGEKRRVDAYNNEDPLEARQLQHQRQQAARMQAAAPPSALALARPQDHEQAQLMNSRASQLMVFGGPGSGKTFCSLHNADHCRRHEQDERKVLVVAFTLRNTERLRTTLRALGVAEHYDVHTWQELLQLGDEEHLKASPEGIAAVVRKLERGKVIRADDPETLKYSTGYKAFATDYYFMHIYDEGNCQESVVYDVVSGAMQVFAERRLVPPLVAGLPFGGQRLRITASLFQLSGFISNLGFAERPVGNVDVPRELLIDSVAIRQLGRFILRGNHRQNDPTLKSAVSASEKGRLSAAHRSIIEEGILRELGDGNNIHAARMENTCLPSRRYDNGIGDQPAGLWCTNMRAQACSTSRFQRHIGDHPEWVHGTDYLTITAHLTGRPRITTFSAQESAALARNVTFNLHLVVGCLYVAVRAPTAPVEYLSHHKLNNAKAGAVFRCTAIETRANPDATSPIPDFKIAMTCLSEPTQPGVIITKSHLNNYIGEMRGRDRLHHSDHGQNLARATQLPFAGFDDMSINQAQGDAVRAAILDLTGIFSTGQWHVALSRVTDRDQIYIVGLGRFVTFEGNERVIDWAGIRKAIAVHPRALIYWDEIGELDAEYAAELHDAQATVRNMQSRRATADGAYAHHGGRAND